MALIGAGLSHAGCQGAEGDLGAGSGEAAARAPVPYEKYAEALSALSILWNQPWVLPGENPKVFTQRVLTQEDWKLLYDEVHPRLADVPVAGVMGLLGPAEQAERKLQQVASEVGLTRDQVYDAVQAHVAIVSASEDAVHADPVTPADVEAYLRDVGEKIQVKLLVLDSAAKVDPQATFSEAQIQSLFEQHRADDPAGADLGVGYLQPWRVKLEYVVVSGTEIVGEGDLPEAVVQRFWEDERSLFPPDKTLDEIRPEVERRLREKLAHDEGQALATRLREALMAPWSDAPRGEDGYRAAPAEAKQEGYLQRVVAETAGSHEHACQVAGTDPVSREEIQADPLLGKVQLQLGRNRNIWLAFLALRAQGCPLATAPEFDELTFARYEATPVLAVRDGPVPTRWVVARVVEVTPPKPAERLDRVRDRVMEDLRRIRAHDEVGRLAAALAMEAASRGLEVAWEAADLPEALRDDRGVMVPPAFARRIEQDPVSMAASQRASMPTPIPGLGVSEAFMEACFDLAREAGARDGSAGAGRRVTRAIGLPELGKWAVVEFVEHTRLAEIPETRRAMAQNRLIYERYHKVAKQWFAPEEIRRRTRLRTASR